MGVALLLFHSWAAAQDFDFQPPANPNDADAPAIMRDLAQRILPVYQEEDINRYLSNLFALQMVAGDYASANASRQSLRERQQEAKVERPLGRSVLYDIYAQARSVEAVTQVPFEQVFAQSFRDVIARFSDREVYGLADWFGTPLPVLQDDAQKAFDRVRPIGRIPLNEAIDVVWAYFAFEAYRSFAPMVATLAVEDDHRRYATENKITIRTADGASLAVMLVRPTTAATPLPALLELTMSDGNNFAHEAASHGYVAVVAYVRGSHGSTGRFVPFQRDGDDARAVIEWITKQPWSDGRVGMYGSGYAGFTAWAAAKRMPEALKAIATSNAMAPGIDFPMAGSIFQHAAYRWAYQVLNRKAAAGKSGDKTFTDDERWRAYQLEWYKTGRRNRLFPTEFGEHSNLFRRWIGHPSYDAFWQRILPFRQQFAALNIPVLTTTGYYANGEAGALYYFTQHHQYNPQANHTLLIGPYEDGMMQPAPSPVVRGYQLDKAALVDLRELRYQWFDHVLKGGVKPALLQDRVNYQVAGTNEWRHAPSLAEVEKNPLRFYLRPASRVGDANVLAESRGPGSISLTVDFRDRSDSGLPPAVPVVSKDLDAHNAQVFLSEPLQQAVELGGVVAGQLDFKVNKLDMDVRMSLYELLPGGEYVKLFDPAYDFRASYAQDRATRQLLNAAGRQQLPFRVERMIGRKVEAGSRVVLVLGVNKRADRQINHGSGDDVSVESLEEDAGDPLTVQWYGGSYIDLPARR